MRKENESYRKSRIYFITINSNFRSKIFSEIQSSEIILSKLGKIIEQEWNLTTEIRQGVTIHDYVIMPDHFHGIIELNQDSHKKHDISNIIKCFKAKVTGIYRKEISDPHFKVWNRNYYDVILRDESHFQNVRSYIQNNPKAWTKKKGAS